MHTASGDVPGWSATDLTSDGTQSSVGSTTRLSSATAPSVVGLALKTHSHHDPTFMKNAAVKKGPKDLHYNCCLMENANHMYICDHHRLTIEKEEKRSIVGSSPVSSPQRKRKRGSNSTNVASSQGNYALSSSELPDKDQLKRRLISNAAPDNDFEAKENSPRFLEALNALSLASLKKLKKEFEITAKANSKRQLVDLLSTHLKSFEVNDKETIAFFVFCVKTRWTKGDGACQRTGTRAQPQ